MKRPTLVIIRVVVSILVIIYPFLIYFGLGVLDIRIIAILLLSIMIVRSAFMPDTRSIQKRGMLGGCCVIVALVLIFNDPLYLKFYPVMMSVLVFSIFTMSLITPPSVIEIFARMHFKEQELPAHVVKYTRNLTKIWCVFFVLNGLVALYTVKQSIEIWTLYNGLISYILMGVLFTGEILFRHFIVKKPR